MLHRGIGRGRRGIGGSAGGSALLMSLDFVSATYTGATPTATRAQTVSSFAETVAGALTTFAADTLRRTDKGLLVEPAASNLIAQTQTLDNAAWTKTNTSVAADSTAAPDATTTADTLTKTSGATFRRATQTITGVISTVYTYSVFAKAGTTIASLRRDNGASFTGKAYNLSTLAITDPAAESLSGYISSSATAMASSWVRLALTFTSEGSGTSHTYWLLPGSSADATNGLAIFFWGAQVETGTLATSHIPGQATRAADSIAFTVPANVTRLIYTFDDDSTQEVAQAAGAYIIPTNLTRRYIKNVVGRS